MGYNAGVYGGVFEKTTFGIFLFLQINGLNVFLQNLNVLPKISFLVEI